jgi:flavin reductase (DIM6/NTAB) family NADH-FMN oxidoreductase RutF/ADP-ribose pyrophosphatase YjhB (NUDIX family)
MTATDVTNGLGTDPLVFRRTLGKFLTGVTIVATRDSAGKRWGMTANSFSSVSLAPPLISICIADRSPSFPAFVEAESFGVSILSSEQQDVAMRFAKPFEDKFDGLPFAEPRAGSPVLDSSAATLVCRTVQRIVAGDHVILVGEVLECAAHDEPLLGYSEGRFFRMDPHVQHGTLVPRSGREVDFGWLIEQDKRLLLFRDRATQRWTIPMGALAAGTTMSESMSRSARNVLGVDVEPQFLYSTLDLSDERTCYVYRATSTSDLPSGAEWGLFDEQSVPWDEFKHDNMIPMVRRYFTERERDNFGIFLNLGSGRIAQLSDEAPWPID